MEMTAKVQLRNALLKLEKMTEQQFLADCRSLKIKGVQGDCEKCLVARWLLGKFSDESITIEVAPPFVTIFNGKDDSYCRDLPRWVDHFIDEFDDPIDSKKFQDLVEA